MSLNQKPSQSTTTNAEPLFQTEGEFTQWGKKLERLAQAGVKREIAEHKAHGRSIFYSRDGVLIMELADGRCFEYHLVEDGTREIIREVAPR